MVPQFHLASRPRRVVSQAYGTKPKLDYVRPVYEMYMLEQLVSRYYHPVVLPGLGHKMIQIVIIRNITGAGFDKDPVILSRVARRSPEP